MSPALYAAFAGATVALLLIPGPNVALIVATSLARGPRGGLATVMGTTAAMLPQLGGVALGLSALLGRAAEAFFWARWLGVAYLAFLGLRAFLAPAEDLAAAPPPRALFWRGFLVSLSNPKTLLFFAAFLPQFLDPRAALPGQIALLSATFLVLALCVDCGWVLLAAKAARALKIGGRARNRLTGGLLLGAGLGLALVRRP